jgi:hypothetical protein
MELKPNYKNGCFPSFGNNFLTLFGLMMLDEEDRKRKEEKSTIEIQEGIGSASSRVLRDDVDESDDAP